MAARSSRSRVGYHSDQPSGSASLHHHAGSASLQLHRSGSASQQGEFSPSSYGAEVASQGGALPSSKFSTLAHDLGQLETECDFLEQRNSWLAGKLLRSQRRFVEQLLSGNTQVQLRRSFEAWRDAKLELRLEGQLNEQTASLDQCQRVAKELGEALTQEQEARRVSEAEQRSMQEDLQRALQQERKLRQQFEEQRWKLELSERRLHEAETCLVRSRSDAEAVVEAARAFEADLAPEPEAESGSPTSHRRGRVSSVEYGIKLREEAHGVMQKVSSLLSRNPSVITPEREH